MSLKAAFEFLQSQPLCIGQDPVRRIRLRIFFEEGDSLLICRMSRYIVGPLLLGNRDQRAEYTVTGEVPECAAFPAGLLFSVVTVLARIRGRKTARISY